MTLNDARRKVEEAKAKMPHFSRRRPLRRRRRRATSALATFPGSELHAATPMMLSVRPILAGRQPLFRKSPRYGSRVRDCISFSPRTRSWTLRFDPPFDGPVYGVKLGDSFEDVKARLGQPVSSWDFGDNKVNLYRVGDIDVRFDVDHDGKVATIFYFKRS
jgi:hypothetical protein